MMEKNQRQTISYYLYFSGLMLLAVSLPLSKFTISISQFLIAGGWLLQGDFPARAKAFIRNKAALLLVSVYILHLAGLIHTVDFGYAFKDLRIKLPLLILPFLLATGPPLSTRHFNSVLVATVAGVLISTAISFLIYTGIYSRPVTDIRDISIFISHIRLALLCCISIFILIYFSYRAYIRSNYFYTVLLMLTALWLIWFITLIQNLSGIIIIGSVLVAVLIAGLLRLRRPAISLIVLAGAGLLLFGLYSRVNKIASTFSPRQTFQEVAQNLYTPSGNRYMHYADRFEFENGYLVWAGVCEEELEAAWNRRSRIDYFGFDQRGHEIRFTLIRFITSKGRLKDARAVEELSAREVNAVEQGIANVFYLTHSHLENRLHQVLWEFNNKQTGGNPSGHSIMQRLEYWKTALRIIERNPVFGVGTGDVIWEFNKQYELDKTTLDPKWRLRSHNQFLSIAVAFGLSGLVWFVLVLLFLIGRGIRDRKYLYLLFAWTAIVSMISEDTLETQAGITFFVFFTCLFLFIDPEKSTFGGNEPRDGSRQGYFKRREQTGFISRMNRN